jgi:hypothetical protein
LGKASAILLNFDPSKNAKDSNGFYRFENYTYNRIDQPNWPLDTQSVGDHGKSIEKFRASDMEGSNYRVYLIPTTQVSWGAPSVVITVNNKSTGASASPFNTPGNPSTVTFGPVTMGNGVQAWYYDLPFSSPPALGKYVFEIKATFNDGSGGTRTYFVDPEMDCTSDSR